MTDKQNMLADLSTLTKIPVKAYETIFSKLNLCIGNAVYDAVKESETALVLNIGLGTLSISLTDMQCKFIPSKELKAAIKKGLVEKADPLELALEEALIQKLLHICQEEI